MPSAENDRGKCKDCVFWENPEEGHLLREQGIADWRVHAGFTKRLAWFA